MKPKPKILKSRPSILFNTHLADYQFNNEHINIPIGIEGGKYYTNI